jgi:hypothetical protein
MITHKTTLASDLAIHAHNLSLTKLIVSLSCIIGYQQYIPNNTWFALFQLSSEQHSPHLIPPTTSTAHYLCVGLHRILHQVLPSMPFTLKVFLSELIDVFSHYNEKYHSNSTRSNISGLSIHVNHESSSSCKNSTATSLKKCHHMSTSSRVYKKTNGTR